MKSLFLLSFFILSAKTASPLDEVRERFRKHSEFKVNFTQTVEEQEFFPNRPDVAKGELEFKRTGYVRWVYTEPKDERKEIIYDGKSLKVLRPGSDPEVVPHNPDLSLEESFSFLWGHSDSKLFETEVLSKTEFVLRPKDKSGAQFKSIRVKVKQGVVQEALITDMGDGKSRLSFHDWRFESKRK